MAFHIKVFVEERTLEAAEKVMAEICAAVQKFGTVEDASCSDYWKIVEYKQIEFELKTNGPVALSDIALIFGTGWNMKEEHFWIWGNIEDGKFLMGSVRWALIEVLGV